MSFPRGRRVPHERRREQPRPRTVGALPHLLSADPSRVAGPLAGGIPVPRPATTSGLRELSCPDISPDVVESTAGRGRTLDSPALSSSSGSVDAADRSTAEVGHGARASVRLVWLDVAQGAEMLSVGFRGPGGFAGLLLGSVGAACVERAHCPWPWSSASTVPRILRPGHKDPTDRVETGTTDRQHSGPIRTRRRSRTVP